MTNLGRGGSELNRHLLAVEVRTGFDRTRYCPGTKYLVDGFQVCNKPDCKLGLLKQLNLTDPKPCGCMVDEYRKRVAISPLGIP